MADTVLTTLMVFGLSLSAGWLLWCALRTSIRFYATRRLQATVVATALITSSSAYAYFCPDFLDETVTPKIKLVAESLAAQIMAVDGVLSAQLEFHSERVLSAIAVLTKQKAVAANQIGNSSRVQSQQIASGMGVIRTAARQKAVRLNHGSEYGQGVDPCRIYAQRKVIAGRDADMAREVRGRIAAEVYAAPGVYMDGAQSREKLVEAHQPFCTQDQVDAGLCKAVGTLPGASLNAGTLFNPAMGAEDLYKAKSAYINNVVGMTDSPVPEGAGTHAAATTYAMAKGSKDAIVSPAIVALKDVQLFNSGVEGSHSGTDLPLSMLFQNEVNRYAGGSIEYDNWSNAMAKQVERGVMVELLKVEALRLAVAGKKLEALDKQEAMLAALVALEARRAQEGAARQDAGNAMSRAVTPGVQ
ncbi:MAG: hypothetical protein FWF12_03535 [Betaproteobacteria bacterium]|nr:hypothetical protein [Betaproteobacteria bacterium]